VKEVGEASNTSRPAGRRRRKPAAVGVRREKPHLLRTTLSTSRADQRPGILIVGSCRGEVFVADEFLIYAETLGGEETVRAWLVQHGIHMVAPSTKTASTDKGSSEASRS
jgi:hypothetical protein